MNSNRKNIVGVILAGSLAALALVGCQTAGVLTGEENATGRDGVIWANDLPPIDPPSPDRNTVYVQFQDVSGRSIDLRNELREEYRKRGYEVVATPDTADYKIQVRLTAFDRREAGDRRDGTGDALSTAGGAATRQVTGGGIIGGLFEDLSVTGFKNRTTAREWCMVANFTLAQKIEGGVYTSDTSSRSDSSANHASRSTPAGSTGGSGYSNNGQVQAFEQMKNHVEYRSTLTAFSTKYFQSEAEARGVLLAKLLSAAAEALPPVN